MKKGGRKVGKKHGWKEGRWGSNKIRGRARKVDGSIGKEQGEARGRGKDTVKLKRGYTVSVSVAICTYAGIIEYT